MRTTITFLLDGNPVGMDFSREGAPRPTTTLLEYLRSLPGHRGTKEGCAEGDCGACTVAIAERTGTGALRYRAVDSCLLFLPMIDGRQVITVESLRSPAGELHPVQKALVGHHGSQCGYCTPGFVMSLFALFKSPPPASRTDVDDALAGNLCRCTGYRSIVDAALDACACGPRDHLSEGEGAVAAALESLPRESFGIRTPGRTYLRPTTIEEACRLVEEIPDAVVITGGTDVALRVTKNHEELESVIDLGAVAELKRSIRAEGGLRLGAGIPLADIPPLLEGTYPALAEMLSRFGSRQVRNCATLGGNLGTASPIGDTAPALIACGASVLLRGLKDIRTVLMDDFITGYRKTAREPGELIEAVCLPPPDDAFVRYYKISRRRDLDIATLSAGFRLRVNGGGVESVTLAFGGMAERTVRAVHAEQILTGGAWTRARVEEAADALGRDLTPITDVRGTAEFRMLAARNLLLKFWLDTNG